jgi:hypothetical protein
VGSTINWERNQIRGRNSVELLINESAEITELFTSAFAIDGEAREKSIRIVEACTVPQPEDEEIFWAAMKNWMGEQIAPLINHNKKANLS